MFAIATIANAPTSLTLPPSVLGTTAPTDAVSTRQTATALAAPLNNLSLDNNSKPSAPITLNANIQTANAQQAAASNDNGVAASTPSSSFLAQLIGQNDQSPSVAQAATTASFTPAPAYDTFVEYSFIKFKPSYAGLTHEQSTSDTAPSGTSEATATASTPIPIKPVNQFSAYSNTVTRNQSQLLDDNLPQISVAG